MLILSLDTSSRAGSCALVRDERVLREQAGDSSREQAERLPGELAALLERESSALCEIDCFAVATGPGSFTGLRVGIATMQGLAMAAGKPLIGVSAFDALAAAGASAARYPPGARGASAGGLTRHERIVAWVDAWRGEVFAAVYEGGREMEAPTVARPDDLLRRLRGQAAVFTGDGVALYQERIRATLGEAARFTDPAAPLLAGVIAALALNEFRAGQRPLPHAIRPLYLRRPDAELARDAGRTAHAPADPKGPPGTP